MAWTICSHIHVSCLMSHVPFVPNDTVSYIRFQVNWFKLKTHHTFEKSNECTQHAGISLKRFENLLQQACEQCNCTLMLRQKNWWCLKWKREREVMMYSTMVLWFDDQKCMESECSELFEWRNHVESAQTVCTQQIYFTIRSMQRHFLFRELAHMLRTHIPYG